MNDTPAYEPHPQLYLKSRPTILPAKLLAMPAPLNAFPAKLDA
jgi:hypothetical protein